MLNNSSLDEFAILFFFEKKCVDGRCYVLMIVKLLKIDFRKLN